MYICITKEGERICRIYMYTNDERDRKKPRERERDKVRERARERER
jgi:hypothetical protein